MYVDVVGARDPTTALEPELLHRIGELVQAGDRAGAGALIPGDVLSRFVFAEHPPTSAAPGGGDLRRGGAAGRLRHAARNRWAAGVELLCREVLPRLRVS